MQTKKHNAHAIFKYKMHIRQNSHIYILIYKRFAKNPKWGMCVMCSIRKAWHKAVRKNLPFLQHLMHIGRLFWAPRLATCHFLIKGPSSVLVCTHKPNTYFFLHLIWYTFTLQNIKILCLHILPWVSWDGLRRITHLKIASWWKTWGIRP